MSKKLKHISIKDRADIFNLTLGVQVYDREGSGLIDEVIQIETVENHLGKLYGSECYFDPTFISSTEDLMGLPLEKLTQFLTEAFAYFESSTPSGRSHALMALKVANEISSEFASSIDLRLIKAAQLYALVQLEQSMELMRSGHSNQKVIGELRSVIDDLGLMKSYFPVETFNHKTYSSYDEIVEITRQMR